jgi:predicted ATPase
VAPHSIIGRAQELDIVVRFFDGEPSNAHGLLIEGEAGIGKTSVWREAVRIAEGRGLVLTSRASDAEARLAFTVLGDLLVPALNDDVLAELPVGQRRAIEAALLLAEPTRTRPDSRAVSLAVLAVLRVLAANGPMTIAVDDVQWVDTRGERILRHRGRARAR